jgi:hypothetical protein
MNSNFIHGSNNGLRNQVLAGGPKLVTKLCELSESLE